MTTNALEWINMQLGAAFEMLSNAINNANDDVWDNQDDERRFWNIAFHVLYFCDIYLSDFDPTMENVEKQHKLPKYLQNWEEAIDFDEIHEPPISKDILLKYLIETRVKLHKRFADGTVESEMDKPATTWLKMSKGSVLIYNMRHIMQHVGHLNDILRKHDLTPSEWIGQIPI